MQVVEFNINKGLYVFDFQELDTAMHSHPAIELIYAIERTFSLSTSKNELTGLTFAIVDCNVPHKLSATNCNVKVLMIEHNSALAINLLTKYRIYLKDGLHCQWDAQNHLELLSQLVQTIINKEKGHYYDPRVMDMINYIEKNTVEYNAMIELLKHEVHLSESRMSHLFKQNIGISLKKYVVWNRLKLTIENHLNKKEDLFTSLLLGGFYDQPHFIKAFKSMLGVTPAKTYNSRTLQS